MGGKCPFWLFVGLLSSDESVQSRSVCRTEKRVFFIVFVGIPDIFLIQKSALTFPDFCSSSSLRPNSQVLTAKSKKF